MTSQSGRCGYARRDTPTEAGPPSKRGVLNVVAILEHIPCNVVQTMQALASTMVDEEISPTIILNAKLIYSLCEQHSQQHRHAIRTVAKFVNSLLKEGT